MTNKKILQTITIYILYCEKTEDFSKIVKISLFFNTFESVPQTITIYIYYIVRKRGTLSNQPNFTQYSVILNAMENKQLETH